MDNQQDTLITPEKSVFRTHFPRPTHSGLHLLIVAVTFLVALGFAIYYAEKQSNTQEETTTSSLN